MTAPSLALRQVDDAVFSLRGHVAEPPRVGLVLGSGLGGFAETLEGLVKVPYGEIPHLPVSKVVGHAGNLCFGKSQHVPVVCMQGRLHFYEGHPLDAVVLGVRIMARLGVRAVIVTNAAGGLEPSWAPGDLMLIDDHLNLAGQNPLMGPNEDALGPRFPDMTDAYDPGLRAMARAVAKEKGITLRSGIYAWMTGPSYETPAEIRMLKTLGAQAVGMSTVPEVIVLRHMGVRVAAVSCVTNLAAGIAGKKLEHAEVEAVARSKQDDLTELLKGWIAQVGAAP